MAAVNDRNVVAVEQWAKIHGWKTIRGNRTNVLTGQTVISVVFDLPQAGNGAQADRQIVARWRWMPNGNCRFVEAREEFELYAHTSHTDRVADLKLWLKVPITPASEEI